MPLLRPFTSSTAKEAARRSVAARGAATRAPKATPSPYDCPPCRDSGQVLVRRYAPADPNATLAGWLTYFEPCPASPCKAEIQKEGKP